MALLIALAAAISLNVPGRGAATPSIAAHGSTVVVVFSAAASDGVTDVFAAVSRDGGIRFGVPVRVNDLAGGVDVNGEQPPRVELVDTSRSEPDVVVVWTARQQDGTRLMQARSSDGGRTFAPARVVAGSMERGNRGWESVAGSFVLWLDHRELARDTTAATAHVHGGGESMAERSKLFIGTLDGSVDAKAITGGVCYCCKTALAVSGISVYAAWRHVFPGSVRDIAFTVSHDAGRTFAPPTRVSDDKWVLQGCPENGPALAVDGRQRVHVVWPTLTKEAAEGAENLALFYASSSDASHFSARRGLPTEGTPRHPQVVASADGSLTVAWDESGGGPRRSVVSRVTFDANNEPAFTRNVIGEGVYPALAVGDAVIVAWVAPDGIRVQRAR